MFFYTKLFKYLLPRFVRLNSQLSSHVTQKQPSRVLIRLAGADAANYLQGLITNDINHITENSMGCMYTMFLNTKGRILYDSIVYRHDQAFLIECDQDVSSELATHLKTYKVRRKLSIDVLDNEFSIWTVCNPKGFEEGKTEVSVDKFDPPIFDGSHTFVDPRCRALGYRVIAPKNLELSNDNPQIDCYKQLRYYLGIAEGTHELPPGNCFPLESNCDYLHGVSFHKGCYLGQEVTARTHHTGVVRKRIMPLIFKQSLTDVSFDAAVTGHSKAVGKLRGWDGNSGVGLLRIEEALKAEHLEVDGKDCRTFRPFWWPTEAPKERPT